MPQAGFDPPAQSDNSYEADALTPSHHGWIGVIFIQKDNSKFAGQSFSQECHKKRIYRKVLCRKKLSKK